MSRRTLARRALAAAVLLLATAAPAWAAGVLDRIKATGTLRVCIWPDYYGISLRDPRNGELAGLDIELSAAFARDLGVRLHYVATSQRSPVTSSTSFGNDVST